MSEPPFQCRGEWVVARGLAEHVSWDHPAMDLGGAVADPPYAHLPEKALNRQFAGIAEAAENLDAPGGDALRHFGRVELGDKSFVADFLLGVGHPARPI